MFRTLKRRLRKTGPTYFAIKDLDKKLERYLDFDGGHGFRDDATARAVPTE